VLVDELFGVGEGGRGVLVGFEGVEEGREGREGECVVGLSKGGGA
jgi:hypothetical protein